MAHDNDHNSQGGSGGETLNDRLRRAAAMARGEHPSIDRREDRAYREERERAAERPRPAQQQPQQPREERRDHSAYMPQQPREPRREEPREPRRPVAEERRPERPERPERQRPEVERQRPEVEERREARPRPAEPRREEPREPRRPMPEEQRRPVAEERREPRPAPAYDAPRRPQPEPEPEMPRRRERRRESDYVTVGPEAEQGKAKQLMKWITILGVALGVALIAVIFMTVSHSRQSSQQQQQIEQLQLANEQIQLANEYDALNNEFAQYENQTSLLANDSIVQKYAASRAQVEKLLQELKNQKNKSAAQISNLKKEIATLKGILRNYVEQINALNKENQELRTENQSVRNENRQLSQNVQAMTQTNKVLTERMTLAEKLNVTGVQLTPLNKKGKTEKNVTKARQLMVSFTIPQNNSTPVGEKTIWLRITNPEGDLLGGGGSFSFEGSSVPATARKTIEYTGDEITGITIYWDVSTTLTPGDYTVELFTDNYRLASRRFTLKK